MGARYPEGLAPLPRTLPARTWLGQGMLGPGKLGQAMPARRLLVQGTLVPAVLALLVAAPGAADVDATGAPGPARDGAPEAGPSPGNGLGTGVAGAGFYGQLETSVSLFAQTDDTDAPGFLSRTYALAARAGRRWDDRALFATLEGDLWHSPLVDGGSELVLAGNLGVGGELLHAGGRLRTSLAVGASMLVVPPQVDDAGSLGVFVDLRPVGLRFSLARDLRLGLDPLTFTLLMPVLSRIPLVEIEFRTAVYLEHAFR